MYTPKAIAFEVAVPGETPEATWGDIILDDHDAGWYTLQDAQAVARKYGLALRLA